MPEYPSLTTDVNSRPSGDDWNALVVRVGALESGNTSDDTRLDSLETRVTSAEGDITTLDGSIDSHALSLTTLDSRLDTAEVDIDTLQGSVSALDTRLTTAESDINALEAADTALDGRLDTAEADIAAAELTISGHTTDISTLDGRLDSAETNITTLDGRADAVDTSLTSLDGRLDTVEATLTSLGLRNRRVLNFSEYGTPNNPAYDNTPDLEQALADARDVGGAVIWFGDYKEWHFLSAIDANPVSEDDMRHYDSVILLGLAEENTVQHQEEAEYGNVADTYNTRLVINTSDGATWWDQTRSYRFGPLSFRNLTFRTASNTNVFSFGDLGVNVPSFRGVMIKDCYFTNGDDLGTTTSWLTNHETKGYILPTYRTYGIQVRRGYDVLIQNCTFRGWSGAGVLNIQGDRVVMDNCHSILCTLVHDEYDPGAGTLHVPTVISNCWSEAYQWTGLYAESALISNWRAETGYSAAYTPDIDKYALPATVDWAITAGDDEITFTNLPSGAVMANYFFKGMIIELTPDDASEATVPSRFFCVTAVNASSLTFANATQSSYVSRSIAGSGDNLYRRAGIGMTLVGDRITVNGFSCGSNENQDHPEFAFVPGTHSVELNGRCTSLNTGEDSAPDQFKGIIVSSCAGNSQWGNLVVRSKYRMINHPDVSLDGRPWAGTSYTPAIWDEFSGKQIFKPGYGVGGATAAQSRAFTYRKIADADIGEDRWCYKLSDHNFNGVVWHPLRYSEVALSYEVWVHASETVTLRVSAGNPGTINTHSLSAGWQKVTGSILQADVNNGTIGYPYIYTSAANATDAAKIHVALVKVTQ